MTTILVDAGNSRLKWSLLEGGRRSPQQALAYGEQPAVQGAIHHLQQLLRQQPAIRRVVLVHVLGDEFACELQALCTEEGRELRIASPAGATCGIRIAYPNPAHFGADRFVGLLAARCLAPGRSVIVIDAGTAVTVDGMLADGTHLGGLILPGLQLLGDALVRRTQASHMSATPFGNPRIFADNTLQGMGSGCLFALVGALEGICARMQGQMGEAQIILCGGDAARLQEQVRFSCLLAPGALMDGLQYLAER